MKSAILYSSLTPGKDREQCVITPSGTPIFIRIEEFAGDVSQALSAAKPVREYGDYEIVLNTIPLTVDDAPRGV